SQPHRPRNALSVHEATLKGSQAQTPAITDCPLLRVRCHLARRFLTNRFKQMQQLSKNLQSGRPFASAGTAARVAIMANTAEPPWAVRNWSVAGREHLRTRDRRSRRAPTHQASGLLPAPALSVR